MSKHKNTGPWTIEEMTMLYNLKVAGKQYPEIADILSKAFSNTRVYTPNSLQKKYASTDWNFFHEEKRRLEEKADQEATEINEKRKLIDTAVETHERFIRREEARTGVMIDAMQSAIYRLPKPKSSEILYKKPSNRKHSPEHVGVILSDLHIGACHTLEDTGGIAEFNLEIFKERLEIMKVTVLDIVERHRHLYDIPVLEAFVLGDIVAGMNDAGQWSSNYINLDIWDQMMEGVAALRDVLSTWSTAFEKINFYGIYGNHGRVGRRGQEKTSVNWDRLAYEFCKLSLHDYDNIEWVIPKAWFHQVEIMNHSFHLIHGDGIRGSMGIPFYGVERAQSNISAVMDNIPDYLLMGHFHTPAELQTTGSRVIMNGSFMGGDMYSIKDLRRCDKAEQKLFGIHPKQGVTWTYNIQLEK